MGRKKGKKNNTTVIPRAPYNFVPFSNTVLFPYTNAKDLPAHNTIDCDRKTGEIHVVFRAETPVLVGSGEDERKNKNEVKENDENKKENEIKEIHFFKDNDGKYTIPGSTIRGLIRENCQILGFGKIKADEDFEDYNISFREIFKNDDALHKHYHKVVDKKVKAGYLYKEGEKYVIYPIKDFNEIKKIPRDAEELADIKELTIEENGKVIKKYVDDDGMINEWVIPVDYVKQVGSEKFAVGTLGASHTLLCTGKYVGKENRHYLFPPPDRSGEAISVGEEDINAFRKDYEDRKAVLKREEFWKLPEEEDVPKPIFYVENDSHIYMGMSKYPRIEYPHKISQGLPDEHNKKDDAGKVDYPHALFGFTDNTDDNKEINDTSSDDSQEFADDVINAYSSRVSVGSFKITDETINESKGEEITPASPKPSWYYGYLEPKSGSNGERKGRYIDNDFRLRGYKQYWLKDELKDEFIKDTGNDNPKTKVKIFPLSASKENPIKFKGVIKFENLDDMELGLLLWAIRLNKKCYHTIGMGKAFGLGRMSAEIEKLNLFKSKKDSYLNLSASPWDDCTSQIDKFISDYDKNALSLVNEKGNVSAKDEIQDFFYMKSKIRPVNEVSYMSLDEYSNVTGWLPAVRKIRQEDDEWQKKGII